ncbi:potassium channel family protein [Novipirellula rosea]|uniref:Potassium channel domain-containing protein n=1 Tax=Novipirellula rosea TaxID=1031540 RepID=A0ABP8MDD7_9BACT
MTFWGCTIVGFLLTLLGVWETFMAVLHPRAVVGPVTTVINRGFHRVVDSSAIKHSRWVVFTGPVLITIQVLCWATLLLIGVSLIVWPQLGDGIVPSGNKPIDSSFSTAIYYAGFTITTLGTGDLVPENVAMRMLTITTAGLGFSYFTLVLAYVISIYSRLARRNQFACEIDYRTQRTGDCLVYLKPYLVGDDPSLIHQDLYTLASNMAELLESHHFYSVLHYFRFNEPRYAMSRMLRFCLEVASLLTALREAGGPNASSISEPESRLWHASRQMLDDTHEHFIAHPTSDHELDTSIAERLCEQLQSESPDARPSDPTKFIAAYTEICKEWFHDLRSLEIGSGD